MQAFQSFFKMINFRKFRRKVTLSYPPHCDDFKTSPSPPLCSFKSHKYSNYGKAPYMVLSFPIVSVWVLTPPSKPQPSNFFCSIFCIFSQFFLISLTRHSFFSDSPFLKFGTEVAPPPSAERGGTDTMFPQLLQALFARGNTCLQTRLTPHVSIDAPTSTLKLNMITIFETS